MLGVEGAFPDRAEPVISGPGPGVAGFKSQPTGFDAILRTTRVVDSESPAGREGVRLPVAEGDELSAEADDRDGCIKTEPCGVCCCVSTGLAEAEVHQQADAAASEGGRLSAGNGSGRAPRAGLAGEPQQGAKMAGGGGAVHDDPDGLFADISRLADEAATGMLRAAGCDGVLESAGTGGVPGQGGVGSDTINDQSEVAGPASVPELVSDSSDSAVGVASPSRMSDVLADLPAVGLGAEGEAGAAGGIGTGAESGADPGSFAETTVTLPATGHLLLAEALPAEATAGSDGTPAEPQTVTEQVVRSAVLRIARGLTRFEMRLEPPGLGRVGVSVDLEAGSLSVMFSVESETVRQLLQGSMAQLRESLSAHGLAVGGLEVRGFSTEAGRQERGDGAAVPAGSEVGGSVFGHSSGEEEVAVWTVGMGNRGTAVDCWA